MARSVRTSALLLLASVLVGGLGLPASAHDRVVSTETEFIQIINQERAKRGLPEVVSHKGLREKTWRHSRNMAESGFFDHRGFTDRVNEAPPDPPEPNGPPDDGFTAACENIAKFSGPSFVGDEEAAGRFFDQWLNSDPHRECMFDQTGFTATAIGIGVWHTDSNNEWHATMIHVADSTPPESGGGGGSASPCELATQSFSSGDDTIIGTSGDDILCGGGGNDTIDGLGGNDIIIGGPGHDVLSGGDGFDRVVGNAGDDVVDGGGNHDGPAAPALAGPDGAGLASGARQPLLHGGDGDDVVAGGPGHDQVAGGNGRDRVAGNSGHDDVFAGNGDDGGDMTTTADGRTFQPMAHGGAGNDVVRGQPGEDDVVGGRGDDVLRGQADPDRINGGPGFDRCDGSVPPDLSRVGCEAR